MNVYTDRVVPLLIPGTPVVTEDGHNLGTVAVSKPGFFRVKPHWHFGFWLPAEAIDEVSAGQVKLLIPLTWVDNCKVEPPVAA